MTSRFARRTHHVTAVVVVIALVVLAHGWLLQAWAGDRAVLVPDAPVAPVTVALAAAPAAAPPPASPVINEVAAPRPAPRKKPAIAQATPAPAPAPAPVPAPAPALSDTAPAPAAHAVEVDAPPRRAAPVAEPPASAPGSARLRYALTRGALSGQGQLNWSSDGASYRMELIGEVPLLGRIFVQRSDGLIRAHGLEPVRHTERRVGRSERALNFIRNDDGSAPRLSFSGRTDSLPLQPGTQDRLSWMAQLAARLAAGGATPPARGSQIHMDVASVSGDVQPWSFILQDADPAGLWHWRRESDDPHDTRAEVWTDPRRQHWPVRVQLRESSGDPLELVLRDWQPGPP